MREIRIASITIINSSCLVRSHMRLSREENYEGLTGLSKLWFDLDRMILKPFLVDDWENCFKEHIDLSKKIKKTMNE